MKHGKRDDPLVVAGHRLSVEDAERVTAASHGFEPRAILTVASRCAFCGLPEKSHRTDACALVDEARRRNVPFEKVATEVVNRHDVAPDLRSLMITAVMLAMSDATREARR